MKEKVLLKMSVLAIVFAASLNSVFAQYYCNGALTNDPCANYASGGYYNACQNGQEYKSFKKMLNSGKCERTITKTKTFGNCTATVILGAKSKKAIKYSSSGGDCVNKMKNVYH